MSLTLAAILFATLDVLVIAAVGYVCRIPFRIDRPAGAEPVALHPGLEPSIAERLAA